MTTEEIKNEFINCIEGTHTLNLAISVLEDREELKKQQEEFMKFLEDNYNKTHDIWYIKVLEKYKELGGKNKCGNNR